MLEPVEVFVQRRQSTRRAVDLICEVVSDLWDEPVAHRVRDLSPQGLFLDTPLPVDPGTELVLELIPPGCDEPLYLFGSVRRVEMRRRADEERGGGLGIELLDTPWDVQELLREALRGLPPPLPKGLPPTEPEMVWVETLLTWEEELDDRVNVFEVSDVFRFEEHLEAKMSDLELLGEFQTTIH
ncbi:MAG: PilZ domain-containing protein [Myxococcota bacterium]